jgi:hypothetical protein
MCEFPKNIQKVAILLFSVYLTKLEERDLRKSYLGSFFSAVSFPIFNLYLYDKTR